MGKNKKKESKKGDREKSAFETSDDGSSKVSLVSITPSEEELSTSFTSISAEPVKKEIEVMEEVYEKPVLTQLIVENYNGEMLNGLYEGEGVALFKDGNIYSGMFSEGLMHGKGKYTWTDGLTYEGDFYLNIPIGCGIYKWPNGSQYEGDVYKAIRHGNGIYTSSDGQVSYVGSWHKGKRHGKGVIYYNKEGTSWYDGDWIANNKEGWGVQCFSSCNVYEGQWKNNQFHGQGKIRWLTSNEEYTGQWVNGIQNGSGTHTWFLQRVSGTQYSLRNEYVGNVVNGKREGQGQFYYANGAMYDGEWKNNKKHGMGKFVFKNGQIYIGEFVHDQIAEHPNFKYDRVNTPDLSGIHTQSLMNSAKYGTFNSGIPSLSGSFMELDLFALLNTFPEEERQEELKQVEYAVLRNLTELRKIYKFYSSLGNDDSIDNALIMTKMQFWRFLKDCKFHHYDLTLSELDRILTVENVAPEEIHSPHSTMLLRTFLTNIVYLAYHVFHTEDLMKSRTIADCFTKAMVQNILPNATNVRGFLFSDAQKTSQFMPYIDKSWDIYRLYCQTNILPPYEPTMKMRHFLFLMNNFRITNKCLTATTIVDVLAEDDPCVRIDQEFNLELELTFLEFYEALLGCATVCVTDELIQESTNDLLNVHPPRNQIKETTVDIREDHPNCIFQFRDDHVPEEMSPRNSIKLMWQKPPVPFSNTKKQNKEAREDKSFHQMNIFFLKMLFPAQELAERLKEEIPKNRERQAEKARLERIREEEYERCKAEREAEEAKRFQQEELEKANAQIAEQQAAREGAEDLESPQLSSIPTDELPATQRKPTTPGKKRRK